MKRLVFLIVAFVIGGLLPISRLMPETKISAEEIETDVIIDEDIINNTKNGDETIVKYGEKIGIKA